MKGASEEQTDLSLQAVQTLLHVWFVSGYTYHVINSLRGLHVGPGMAPDDVSTTVIRIIGFIFNALLFHQITKNSAVSVCNSFFTMFPHSWIYFVTKGSRAGGGVKKAHTTSGCVPESLTFVVCSSWIVKQGILHISISEWSLKQLPMVAERKWIKNGREAGNESPN